MPRVPPVIAIYRTIGIFLRCFHFEVIPNTIKITKLGGLKKKTKKVEKHCYRLYKYPLFIFQGSEFLFSISNKSLKKFIFKLNKKCCRNILFKIVFFNLFLLLTTIYSQKYIKFIIWRHPFSFFGHPG